MDFLTGKHVVVTGGTGSLGRALVRRLLTGEVGLPQRIVVFSRDEAKQHFMRLAYANRAVATDEVIYDRAGEVLSFVLGDVRDYGAVRHAMQHADVVFNAAAIKQVPTCEYFPFEAVQTNVLGAQNIVRALREGAEAQLVVGVSTDKACKPVNVMGMSKALQERILVEANRDLPLARLVCVRYGNVVASRGSVVPLFIDQIRRGGPVTITVRDMTRFLITLDQAVSTIFAATQGALRGQTYVPIIPSARVVDIAIALMGDREVPITYTGIRPGEKLHEVLVSEEECPRTYKTGNYYVVDPVLPELRPDRSGEQHLTREYVSSEGNLDARNLAGLLAPFADVPPHGDIL
jgi:UDP-glucose 4-epimerase